MTANPAAPQVIITWSAVALTLVAILLAAMALLAVITALAAAGKPLVRWDQLKLLALALLFVVPALAVVAAVASYGVLRVERSDATTWTHSAAFGRKPASPAPLARPVVAPVGDVQPLPPEQPAVQIEIAGDVTRTETEARNQAQSEQRAAVAQELTETARAAEAETAEAAGAAIDPLLAASLPTTDSLHVSKTARGLPDWAEKEAVPADEGILVPLSSQRFATLQEAEQQVTAQAVQYISRFYRDEYPLSGNWTVPVSLIREHAVGEFVGEELDKDFGKMYRAHLRLKLDASVRRAVHESWHEQIAQYRLKGFGGALGAVTLVLGTIAGYLKLDDLTSGQFRTRLKLAAAAVLAASTLLAVIVA